jgi:hypothetical protein
MTSGDVLILRTYLGIGPRLLRLKSVLAQLRFTLQEAFLKSASRHAGRVLVEAGMSITARPGCFGDSQEWARMVWGDGNIKRKRTAAFATGLCVTPVIITPPEFNAIRPVAY